MSRSKRIHVYFRKRKVRVILIQTPHPQNFEHINPDAEHRKHKEHI